MPREKVSLPETIAADERRKRWVDLRAAGYTFAQIGALESPPVVWQAVQKGFHKYMRRYHGKSARRWRDIQTARLEALISAHMPKALAGDREITLLVLRLIERECRLHGADLTQETPLVQQINQIMISYQQSQDWRIQAEEGEEEMALPAVSGESEPEGAHAD